MPRYFFNTRIDGDLIKDHGGIELRDPEVAWEVAQDTAHSMIQDPATQLQLLTATLVVTDEAGEMVLEFPFAEALTVPPIETGTVH